MTLTPEQQCVYDWLDSKLDLPVYAEVYKGTLYLLENKLPGYITFVTHAGRELMNGLGPAFAGSKRGRFDYKPHVDKLQNVWKDEWGGQGLTTPDDAAKGNLIPYDICRDIRDLIDGHKAGHERDNRADTLFFTSFLNYDDIGGVPTDFLREWKIARKWFQGHAHLRDDRFPEKDVSSVEKHFRALDSLLCVAASSEFERLREIDEILEETNG